MCCWARCCRAFVEPTGLFQATLFIVQCKTDCIVLFVSISQKGRGSGLGLAFRKLPVEAHGQQIWVDTLPGQGTVLTFTIAYIAVKESSLREGRH